MLFRSMEILIRLAQYHDSKGHYNESDYVDKLLLRIAKSEDGEDFIKGVEWKNPNFQPEDLQELENKIYPLGFHYYQDVDIPEIKSQMEYLPQEMRTLSNLPNLTGDMFGEVVSEGTDKVIVDGEPDKFYFVLELNSKKKEIEAADLTVSEEKIGRAHV